MLFFMSEEDRESLSKVRQSFAQDGRKPSLVDNAYVALKEVIRDGVLPPGYQGSEQEIAGKLNMSRTPVHEAIIRLQSEGLVKVLPKRGVLVCSISPDDCENVFPSSATGPQNGLSHTTKRASSSCLTSCAAP